MKTDRKLRKSRTSNFMKLRLVVLELFYAYGQMELRSQQCMYVGSSQDSMYLKLWLLVVNHQ